MALSAFDDPDCRPTPPALRRVLAGAHPLWKRIISDASGNYPPITEQWNCAGAAGGWSLRLKRRDRVLLYMTPQVSGILIGVVLGEKAAQAAHAAKLPGPVLELIDGAPRYAEGRGIRLTVAAESDLSVVGQLLALKAGAAPDAAAKSPRRTRNARR